MANNITLEPAEIFSVVVDDPASPTSGSPVRYNKLTGIALTDEGGGGNPATQTTVHFGRFICSIPVTSTLGAIAVGDTLWYNDAIDGVDNTTTGTPFGIALGTVAGGPATTTISVLHFPYPTSTLGAGSVGATQLAANAVTSSKILASNVLTAAINDLAVTTGKINDLAVTNGKLVAPDGLTLNVIRTAKFEFDFATDAHVVGTTVMRGETLPAKARIVSGHCYVKNALTGAGGTTASIQVTGANDIIADAAVAGVPWSTADAMVPVVPANTTATCVKSEAAGGKPSLVITTHDLTAGHIDLWLNYVVHD